MREPGQRRRIAVIVGVVVLVAVLAAAVSLYVGQQARRAAQERRQVEYEEDRLKTLDLLDRGDKFLGRPSSLSPAEQEELRQLRERAAKRKIERGY